MGRDTTHLRLTHLQNYHNNEVERFNRLHIPDASPTTIGSHSGAEAAALYHSTGHPSSHDHVPEVNVFDYLAAHTSSTDVPHGRQNTPIRKIPRPDSRHRWKPHKKK
ncbi:hypothetical protein [Paramuribaculum intestinale]|uniref:hypothetical protein n=1 Tax=Paramuribaculum intestinale TaxID=2094151 RepID=UPI003F68D915